MTLAFRLRLLLGAGTRAEVIRHLLTTVRVESSVAEVAHAAGFGKRGVADTLSELASARVVARTLRGNEYRYSMDKSRWTDLLAVEPGDVPRAVDWIGLLPAVWRIAAWFEEDAATDRSAYLRASEARVLVQQIVPALSSAGISVPHADDAHGPDYWPVFEQLLDNVFGFLNRRPQTAG